MKRHRARLFCRDLVNGDLQSALHYDYTGEHTFTLISHEGIRYRLLTLLGSGILTFEQDYVGDAWLCGGGSGGEAGYTNRTTAIGPGQGGCGGRVFSAYGVLLSGNTTVDIGKGGRGGRTIPGTEAIASTPPTPGGDTILSIGAAYGGTLTSGGSGGGGNTWRGTVAGSIIYSTPPSGQGVSTIPFGDTVNFQPHCAGGASGNHDHIYSGNLTRYRGGDGGSNGRSGTRATAIPAGTVITYGQGGQLGGGDARPSSEFMAGDATYFGGGGGGGNYGTSLNNLPTTSGGDGHAGVVYIRIPV